MLVIEPKADINIKQEKHNGNCKKILCNNIAVLLYSQMDIQKDMIFLNVYFSKLEFDVKLQTMKLIIY